VIEPDDVTGEPETVHPDDIVMPTDVTVPEPAGTCHVASSRRNFVVPETAPGSGTVPRAWEAPDATKSVTPIVPVVVIGPPVIGADVAMFVTVPELPPEAVCGGIS
jgi:hypothetical protein